MKPSVRKAGTGEEPEFIRQFKARPVIFIGTVLVLILVIVAFIFVPAIVPQASGQNLPTFGFWNKKPVTYVAGNYFARQQRYAAQTMQAQMTENNSFYIYYQVWRRAFEETVLRMAILDEMERAGYTPPNDAVDRRVARLPDFQEDGRFSASRWNSLGNTMRISVWEDTRDALIEEKYYQAVTDLRFPPGEGEFIAAMDARQRSFSMVALPLSSWPESEAAAFAAEFPELFTVTHLSRITVKTEREAKSLLQSIESGGTTFEDAAKNSSLDSRAGAGGDTGKRMAWQISREIENEADRAPVLALRAGETGKPVKTGEGWAFYRAEEAPRPADSADPSDAAQIRAYVMEYERGRVEDWVIADAEQFAESIRANGIDRAAFFRGAEVKSFGPLPLNYGAMADTGWGYQSDGVDIFPTLSSFNIPELSRAGDLEIFWKNAFFTPTGTVSAPFVVGENVILLFPVSETETSAEDVDRIAETWRSWWLENKTRTWIRTMFLASDRLEDNFSNAFSQISGY